MMIETAKGNFNQSISISHQVNFLPPKTCFYYINGKNCPINNLSIFFSQICMNCEAEKERYVKIKKLLLIQIPNVDTIHIQFGATPMIIEWLETFCVYF